MEMRAVFGKSLEQMMASDERIVVLDADLARANGTLGLRQKFPERALDLGVAEQNMAGVAAGLASHGFIPFITSFAPFASRRISDITAISIAYAKQNVKIVGTDPGFAAELNGGTHAGIEDIGVMRSTPTMVIVEPSDAVQLEQAMPQIVAHNGPVYLRLYRKEAPVLHDENYKFDLLKADVLRVGTDVTLVAIGAVMLGRTLEAAELLKAEGVLAEVVDMHTVKPIDVSTLIASVKKTRAVVTAENHSVIGGLHTAVCEALSANCPAPVRAVGIPDTFAEVGKLDELLEKYHMTAADIVAQAHKVIQAKKGVLQI